MGKILKKFYQFLFVYKKSFWLFVTMLVVSTILENLNPYFFKLLIDNINEGQRYDFLIGVLFLFVGARLLTNWLGTLAIYLGDRVIIPAARDVRIRIFRYIQDLDFAFHVNKNTGSLISAFKRGDQAFFDLFSRIHENILSAIVSLGVVLFFFSRVNMTIVFIMLGLFALNIAISLVLIRFNMKWRKEFNDAEDLISGIITDNLINYETVKFFAQEKEEERRLRTNFVEWTKKIWGFSNSFRLMDIAIGTLSGLGMLAILWVTIRQLSTGDITTGDFVMVTGFITGFYYRFFELMYRFRGIAKNFIDLEKYFELLDNEIIVKDPIRPKKFKSIEGKIEFKNLSFSYPDNDLKVLDGVDLEIEPGQSVAFVGKSGAGKTTIVKLLLRFYDLKGGQILLDGTDISEMTKSHLRSFLAVVPQEPVLFNNTIGFNIGYGRKNATQKEIEEAASMANLHDFIVSLPERYETQVGERGIKLSGGQKQRLAIARALIVEPKVIIFDEATSNLDSESEKLVQEALWKTAKDRTMLIIAHRFSTIRNADKIVVMDEGRVAEIGTHAQLIKQKGGLYRKLWNLQAKGKLETDEGGLLTKKDMEEVVEEE